ncbi:transcriptional regulator [Pseudomonas fluorescens]|nr:transcriptional regulator [Pseudomonas fluorescens]
MSDFLQRFAHTFATLDKHNLHLLDSLYSRDIAFTDPLHALHGLNALHDYFESLYSNVTQLRFDFHGFDQVAEGEGYLRWKMSFCHPRLANGQVIRVEGCSHLMWRDNKVFHHRDYFDAGALLYEHLPVLGRVVRWLKRRMG